MPDDPTALLKKHGKSFNFARLFLGNETGIAAARLYSFCRIVDDIADESVDKELAKKDLTRLIEAINQNQKNHPLVGDFLMLCEEYDINRRNGITLIEGVTEDLSLQALDTEQEIVQYAFKVAGVVGLMMAPILGAKKEGYPFAIDLGIGMQLTNIARDILEDANMDRRYIPGAWVDYLTPEQISLVQQKDRESVKKAVTRLLELAEKYYKSGLAGLYYLPRRNRPAIAVAAYVYREIGRKLLKQNCEYWKGRIMVSISHKILLACQALLHLRSRKFADKALDHDPSLHIHLLSTIANSEYFLIHNVTTAANA